MKFISRVLNGCVVVRNDISRDSRGYFLKAFQKGEFVDGSFDLDQIEEVFWTESTLGVTRGLHLQTPPNAVSKYVVCVYGRVLDMILDLRSDSATFGQLETLELGSSEDVSHGIYVPKGFAHGFQHLSRRLFNRSGMRTHLQQKWICSQRTTKSIES